MSIGRPIKKLERSEILTALSEAEGIKTKAAEILGVSYQTFKREYRKYFTIDGFDEPGSLVENNLKFLQDRIDKKKATQNISMLNKVVIETESDFIRLIAFGDTHYGAENCDEETLLTVLDWLYKNKDTYVIGMGDLVESCIEGSPGLFQQDIHLNKQFYDMIRMLKPLADEGRLLGLHTGNHEARTPKKTSLDVTMIMCTMLGVKYFGSGMMHEIKVRKKGNKEYETYTFYTAHGSSRANYTHTKMNACRKMAQIAEVDCYIMGHVHALAHNKTEIYTIENGKSIKKEKHFILSGAYLKYWGGYGQEKGYPPSGHSGSPKIKLHADCHRISVSV